MEMLEQPAIAERLPMSAAGLTDGKGRETRASGG